MRYRLRTLLFLLVLGPPTLGVIWAFQNDAAAHRIPELVLIVGVLLIFLQLMISYGEYASIATRKRTNIGDENFEIPHTR